MFCVGSLSNVHLESSRIGVSSHHTESSWLPDKGTLVFLLIAIHLAALCYWCYLTYLSNRYS